MASSALSSVMGSPFKAGSCLGFLSFADEAAGVAAAAGSGKSTPSVKTQLSESKIDKQDFAVSEIAERAGQSWGFIDISGQCNFGVQHCNSAVGCRMVPGGKPPGSPFRVRHSQC